MGVKVGVGALIIAIGMIAVGLSKVASTAPGGMRRSVPSVAGSQAPEATAPTDEEPGKVALSDDVFVDLRTERSRPMPRSLREIPGADHFRVSPDGRWLAFDRDGRIYVARKDGTDLRGITPPDLISSMPSWSPDGGEIVFGTGPFVGVVDVATGSVRTLLHGSALVYRPEFSPDGRTILFTRGAGGATRIGGGSLGLWTVPASGGRATSLRRQAAFGTYSPDGRWIAYRQTAFDGSVVTEMTGMNVWVVRSATGHARSLWTSGGWMSQVDVFALWPAWSPDGTRIAFERTVNSGVYVADLETGQLKRIAAGTRPAWLDDHTLIVEDDKGEQG